MEKLVNKEIDFILEPSYKKINKTIKNITKELINIVGKQYSNIINERIVRTNFVFFNKVSDLKKYISQNSTNLKLIDKKNNTKYERINKNIIDYDKKLNKLIEKISTNFILEIKSELSEKDKEYITKHKKIDVKKLDCYKLFFSDNTDKIIDGLFYYFSNEYEKKLRDKKTTINEMEYILNNREKCLNLLGMKNINIKVFDRNSFEYIFDIIDKYNKQYQKELNLLELDKQKLIDEFLINENLLNDTKNERVSKYFLKILKKDKNEIDKINNKIVKQILNIDEPSIVWASDNCSDDNNIRFLLFSPTMDYQNNDFLFVREICRLAFNSENYNTKSVVQDNSIIGKDNYLMFSNLTIEYIAYQITKRLNENKDLIVNFIKKDDINLDDGLFLVEKFYKNYSNEIIESLINNDKKYISEQIGMANFENFVNIINKYYYDFHGNLICKNNRNKAVFTNTIKNILNISLNNMEQYKKILINKSKYSNE